MNVVVLICPEVSTPALGGWCCDDVESHQVKLEDVTCIISRADRRNEFVCFFFFFVMQTPSPCGHPVNEAEGIHQCAIYSITKKWNTVLATFSSLAMTTVTSL